MSKADQLLKQATSYEKLALYLDRSTFLKALAQNKDPDLLSPEEKERYFNLDQFGNPTPNGVPSVPSVDTLPIKEKMPYLNPEFQKQLVDSGRITQQQSDEAKQRYYASQSDGTQSGSIGNGEPIDKQQQEAVSYAVTMAGAGIPITNDGVMGPETRKALQEFKNLAGKPQMSDRDALALAGKYHGQLSQQATDIKKSIMPTLKGPSTI